MLSILIPTYNYNVLPLVEEIWNQSNHLEIPFEIISIDDGGSLYENENQKINSLKNCHFSKNKQNIGRASNINLLVAKSQFEYCLILEADAFPEHKNFIQNYLNAIKTNPKIAFGGVIYPKKKPNKDCLLRWYYGHKRESKNLEFRIKNPYKIVFTWNLLIQKRVFSQFPFDSAIKDYGFEDLVFIKTLEKNKIKIDQIENKCIHQNEENSQQYINKYHYSLKNLDKLTNSGILNYEDTALSRWYLKSKKVKLDKFLVYLFRKTQKLILKNLKSKYCSLLLFDFYKLGYFCTLKNNKNV